MRSAIESGSRPGRFRERIGAHCAPSIGKHRVTSVWRAPCGSSSAGAYGCIGFLIPLLVLLPLRRHRPSRSTQRLVLALGTPGANPFSGALLPPLVLWKSCVQNNETHPGTEPCLRSMICWWGNWCMFRDNHGHHTLTSWARELVSSRVSLPYFFELRNTLEVMKNHCFLQLAC